MPWTLIYVLRGLLILLAVLITLAFWRISRIDRSEIRSYTSRRAIESRLLGAIVPWQRVGWFFKLTGPEKQVAEQRAAFRRLIESVTFDTEDEKPEWTLPPGWTRLPDDAPENKGAFPRFATIQISSAGGPLELSVTSLPMQSGDLDEYLLANINRWRSQLKLRNIDLAQLAQKTEKVETRTAQATLVEFAGQTPSAPAGAGPLSSMASARPSGRGSGGPTGEPEFVVPDGWTPGGGSSMNTASFQVSDGDQQVKVTVTPLPPSDLLANVNRWRGQVALKEISAQELKDQLHTISAGNVEADYVQLEGPQQTILAAIATHAGQAWFIKLMGDGDLAGREKERFETFVRSFKFD